METKAMDRNLSLYRRADVVEYYAAMEQLLPPEAYVFDRYLNRSMDVLDVGVGGGRTTPYLTDLSRSYVGVDYSPDMVARCQQRYPDHLFVAADAADLSQFADESFDFIIFSFNGIDTILSDAERVRAFREFSRLLRPDGVIVISSHNARNLIHLPRLSGLSLAHAVRRIGQSLVHHTIPLASRLIRSGAAFRGHGYVTDPAHGGVINHVSTPRSISNDFVTADLRVVEIVGAFHPRRVPEIVNPWHTYVLQRA